MGGGEWTSAAPPPDREFPVEHPGGHGHLLARWEADPFLPLTRQRTPCQVGCCYGTEFCLLADSFLLPPPTTGNSVRLVAGMEGAAPPGDWQHYQQGHLQKWSQFWVKHRGVQSSLERTAMCLLFYIYLVFLSQCRYLIQKQKNIGSLV